MFKINELWQADDRFGTVVDEVGGAIICVVQRLAKTKATLTKSTTP